VIGDLAAFLGRWDDAERAFAEAFALLDRAKWAPWEAWTRRSRARMLQQRGRLEDAEEVGRELSRARAIGEELGMTVLLAELDGGTAGQAAPPSVPGGITGDAGTESGATLGQGARDSFRREGEIWTISYEGRVTRVRDSKGLRYLAMLIASPGREIPAVDLAAALGQGSPGPTAGREDELAVAGWSGDAVLDATSRAAYRARLLELQAEIQEVEQFGDADGAERLRTEFEFITRELTIAVGLGGRARRHGGEGERARQSVTKAIRESINRIHAHDAALAGHLRRAVRTGALCVYEPDPRASPPWVVVT
jgi:hypothetical protein